VIGRKFALQFFTGQGIFQDLASVQQLDKADTGQATANRQKKPAATWVYLENDNPFSEFFSNLISSRNIGFLAAAGSPVQILFFLPLLLLRKGRKQMPERLK